MSPPKSYFGATLPLSSIGYAVSDDGIHFRDRRQLIRPEQEWEVFGCEDPRVTFLEGKYYTFYTALSSFPFRPQGIKVGLAITRDFQTVDEKHLVTPFNAKAMSLFPERISGKVAAVLTVHTDMPPAKKALAFFDRESDIWDMSYWDEWYTHLDRHVIPLMRSPLDQVEVGAPPVRTEEGWLLIYSYIKDYRAGAQRVLGIEAVLLDLQEPFRVVGRTKGPLLVPETHYERIGHVSDVVFPTGAVATDGDLLIYYGAADTTLAVARVDLEELLAELRPKPFTIAARPPADRHKLVRFEGNPIIAPRPEFAWEAKATFNPAALALGGRVHLLYRALAEDNTSTLGYASSPDGVHFDERLNEPVYTPREAFEQKGVPGGNSGCEDPRLTVMGDTIYMLYCAFNGYDARVALTSITAEDFLLKRWNWSRPIIISPPEVPDKDAGLLPKKLGGNFAVFHRVSTGIWVDLVDDLYTAEEHWLGGDVIIIPRKDKWDNRKVGIAAPPVETEKGWLLLYHGIYDPGNIYRVGAALLDLEDPTKVIARTDCPLLEPEMPWEKDGLTPNAVFPCGMVVLGKTLFVYYGGADRVIGVAAANLDDLVEAVLRGSTPR